MHSKDKSSSCFFMFLLYKPLQNITNCWLSGSVLLWECKYPFVALDFPTSQILSTSTPLRSPTLNARAPPGRNERWCFVGCGPPRLTPGAASLEVGRGMNRQPTSAAGEGDGVWMVRQWVTQSTYRERKEPMKR